MRPLLLVLMLLDANAPSSGLDPANLGLLRTIAPLGGDLNGVAFSADGRLLAVGCGQGVRVYETRSWRPAVRIEGHPNSVQTVAFSPDGKILAAGGDQGVVVLWAMPEGRILHALAGHAATVLALAFSPDGTTLVTGGQDGIARAWETATGRARANFETGQGPIWAAAFSRDGRRVALGGEADKVRIYRASGWERERQLSGPQVSSLAFSGDGRRLLGQGAFQALAWDVATGAEARKVGIEGGSARFTPDERFVLAGQGAEVRVWDFVRGGEPLRLAHHTAEVTGVAVHPAGRVFVTIGEDRHVKVWGPVPGGMARVRGKGFLGVTVQNTAGGRMMISAVYPASAAEAAGLRTGDLLLSVGGQALETMTQAVDQIGSFQEGDEIDFEIDRGGERRTMKVTLRKRPEQMPN